MSATSRRRAVVIWLVALATYFLAVFHRSSLAVAGLMATERFDISASQLATFAVLQLFVYAAMQIPVGLLVDRFGPRSVLVTGALVLTAAQAGFALAGSYPVALLARLFVGMGDAMTFICVLRLVNSWFGPRRIPLVTQLTGVIGQGGAIVAAVPMTWALGTLGWTGAYLLAASVGVVVTLGLLVLVHDEPGERSRRGAPMSVAAIRASLAASWDHPGTRLGFWMHFTTQFSATTLGLLWGYPFLVRGEGLSEATAGVLLTVMVVAVISAGPVLGWRITVQPWHRSTLVLGIVAAIVVVWTVVLVWPGEAPLPLLVLLVVVTGVGGPASMIGFDLGRTSNPSERLASATGIINQGGFYASLLLVAAIGVVLDWRTPGDSTAYTPEAFRWAMSAQYVLWGLGLAQIWRYRRRARARFLRDDPDTWVPLSGGWSGRRAERARVPGVQPGEGARMTGSSPAPVVVVTGANGLVGSRVCAALAERGAQVRAVVRREGAAPSLPGLTEHVGDFADPDLAARVTEGATALVTTVHPLGGDDEAQRRVAVEGTPVIARAARDNGVPLLVHVSTAAVYDRSPGVGDVDESSALVGDDADVYATTKRDTDAALAQVDGPTRVLLRPPAILGVGESSIWNTVRPQQVRDEESQRHEVADKSFAWVHVDDLARLAADVATGAVHQADDPEQGPVAGGCTPVNVVTGTGTQRDYLGAVTEALGLEPVWDEGEAWTGELVGARARRWGWEPVMGLDDALAELRADLRARADDGGPGA